jgi:hypothetical protein
MSPDQRIAWPNFARSCDTRSFTMLIVLLLAALAVGVLAPLGYLVASLWSSIPRSNADFQWLDV